MADKKEISKKLYEMELHENIKDGAVLITRVPGGWIYEIPRGNTMRITSQFIPFNKEFKK